MHETRTFSFPVNHLNLVAKVLTAKIELFILELKARKLVFFKPKNKGGKCSVRAIPGRAQFPRDQVMQERPMTNPL